MTAPPEAAPRPFWRREGVLAAGIVLLAFAVRAVYVLQQRASPFFEQPEMDPLVHLEWARALVRGETYWDGPFFRAPLYPWFLSVLLRLFGDDLLAVRLVQAALGAATCGFTFLAGRRAFDARTGLFAALFAAVYWVLVYFDGELLLESLSVPLTTLALWLSLRLDATRPRRALLAGLVWGLSAITRPTVLAFVPFLVLGRLLHHRAARTRPLVEAALLLVGVALPILPVAITNAQRGDFALVSTQAGVNLWIGNNPRSDGSTAIVPGTRQDWWGGFHDAVAQAEAAEGRDLKPSEVSSHYTRRALEFVFGEPRSSVPLLLFKLRLFWTNAELGNNQEPRFMARRFGPIAKLLPLGFWFAAPLGLLGMWLARGRWRTNWPLATFVLIYSAVVVAFFVNARFRVPIVPVLLVYAAHACLWIVLRLRERDVRGWIGLGVAALGIVACVLGTPSSVASSAAGGHFLLGYAAARDGDHARAVEELRQAVELRPTSAIAQRALGASLRALGRSGEARAHLERAAQLDSADFAAESLLVDLDLAEGRTAEALARAERVAARAPHEPKVWYDVARCHVQVGAFAAAAAPLERALDLDPDYFYALWSSGLVHERLGDTERAARFYDRACNVKTEAPREHVQQVRGLAAAALRRVGREDRARELERAARDEARRR